MIRLSYPSFRGATGKRYTKRNLVFDTEVPLLEAKTRLAITHPDLPEIMELIDKGLIPAVYERNGQLYPINLECWLHATITQETGL